MKNVDIDLIDLLDAVKTTGVPSTVRALDAGREEAEMDRRTRLFEKLSALGWIAPTVASQVKTSLRDEMRERGVAPRIERAAHLIGLEVPANV